MSTATTTKTPAFLYNLGNPADIMPFHTGEIQVQKLLGSHEHVMSYAPRFIRPYMPDQHREFYESLPFLVLAARDLEGNMWASFLAANDNGQQTRMTTSPDPTTLVIQGQPVPGDALEGALLPKTDLGILGIEFATKRRNRVNGRMVKTDSKSQDSGTKQETNVMTFQVDQSFGNCPQYIKPRHIQQKVGNVATAPGATTNDGNTNESMKQDGSCLLVGDAASQKQQKRRPNHLSEEQMAKIRQAETIFVATGYRDHSHDGHDPRYGNDASHRGGPAGFVRVTNARTLMLPDFSGNGHYNTIGNLVVDDRIGVAFPDYETGAMIQITGRAKIHYDAKAAAAFYPGAERLLEIQIDQVNQLPAGSIPIRWTTTQTQQTELQERSLVVSAKIQESKDVMSFHLRPREDDKSQPLWKFSPGQYLPISLSVGGVDPLNNHKDLGGGGGVERTYSISAGPDWGEYRISVKRQADGLASTFLHDHVHVGDSIHVHKPAGDFVLDILSSNQPIVLLSNGIGITPVLAMLHHWAQAVVHQRSKDKTVSCRPVYWIHGARNSQYHPFQAELEELANNLGPENSPLLTMHTAYSQPLHQDRYDSRGRLSVAKLVEIVPNIATAQIYMCGSHTFIANMEEGLSKLGVPSSQVQYETF